MRGFQNYLTNKYEMSVGSSALGIALQSVNIDIKTTSIVQLQSSFLLNPQGRRYSAWYNVCRYRNVLVIENSLWATNSDLDYNSPKKTILKNSKE